jgi:hypothetical protein
MNEHAVELEFLNEVTMVVIPTGYQLVIVPQNNLRRRRVRDLERL